MTREEAIKCIQEEKLRYERAPWVNGCPMMEEWQKAIDICDMAISALRAQQEQESKPLNGWISVKESLPETDGIYIVCDRRLNGNPWIHTAGFRKASSSWCELHGIYYDDGYGRYSEQDKFTHWQPMPAPLEIEKAEE